MSKNKKNCNKTIDRDRISTEFSAFGDILLRSANNKTYARKLSGLKRKVIYPFDEEYSSDAY